MDYDEETPTPMGEGTQLMRSLDDDEESENEEDIIASFGEDFDS